MSKRAAKCLSAVAAALLAGFSWTSIHATAAPATVECLVAPKGPAPDGGRWKYRLDRATKQKCWYVKTSDSEPARTASTTQPAPPPAPSLQPIIADARAEFTPPQTPTAPAPRAHAVFPAPEPGAAVADSPNWKQSSRWPGQTGSNAEPEPEPAVQVADAAPSETMAATEQPQPPVAEILHQRQDDGSVGMLIAVLAAALAFAGIAAGLVVRFGRVKPARVRGDGFFDAPPPPLETVEDDEPPIRAPGAEPPPMNWIRVARERHKVEQASSEIEQLLASAPRQAT